MTNIEMENSLMGAVERELGTLVHAPTSQQQPKSLSFPPKNDTVQGDIAAAQGVLEKVIATSGAMISAQERLRQTAQQMVEQLGEAKKIIARAKDRL